MKYRFGWIVSFALVLLCVMFAGNALAHKKNCFKACVETREVTRTICDKDGKNCRTVTEEICVKWEEKCEDHDHDRWR